MPPPDVSFWMVGLTLFSLPPPAGCGHPCPAPAAPPLFPLRQWWGRAMLPASEGLGGAEGASHRDAGPLQRTERSHAPRLV